MSTKIYNAYEWQGNINELMDFLKSYRKEYQDNLLKFLTTEPYIKGVYAEAEDDFAAMKRMQDEFTKASRSLERDPLSFDASVSVVFHNDRIFVKQFGFDGSFRPNFSHGKLVDFHYQNQSDEPDDVPYEEFKARGKVWDEILDNSETGSFAEVGLTYHLFSEADIWRLCWKLKTEIRRERLANAV